MASPNKNPEYQAKLPRYGHDMSFDFGFTASTGMLLPIFHDFLNPGESVQGGVQLFTQLQFPLQVPAQIDMEQIVDYFFVPMPMLYQPFESMVYQTNDYLSSAVGRLRAPNQSFTRQMVENFPLAQFMQADGTVGSLVQVIRDYGYSYNWGDLNSFMLSDYDFECCARQAYRLMDMIGMNPDALIQNYVSEDIAYQPMTDYNPNVFPYGLLAYQCVYQYFYRMDMWERFDNHFNWDAFFGQTYVTDPSFLKLHYRPRYLDYFTNVKPSPYLQGMNMLMNADSNADNSANILTAFKAYLQQNDFKLSDFSFSPATLSSNDATQVYNDYDVSLSSQLLRNLKAADKFLQITARAANRYDDQVLAHLGYKVPHDVKHNIKYLGTQRAPFKINNVVSTDSESLGDRAAYATGSVGGNGFKYTAPCHGVLIAIYSCVAKTRYIAGIDRKNVFTSIHDVWQPEYDNLGMQPVYNYELHRSIYDSNFLSSIAGWQWRYEEKKRNYSRVSSAFRKYLPLGLTTDTNELITGPLQENSLSAYFILQQANYQPYLYGGLAIRDAVISNDYVYQDTQGNISMKNPITFDWHSLLTPPSQLDNVLAVKYDDSWHGLDFAKNPALIYQSDPFVIDAHINYKKVSPMSVHSMPAVGD